ncbi:hypothetical protein RCC89_02315 [Cytophagaceae bacterium ABcell3]|nr:hypothetical protein RCC89_02315 [Cytophagaceae bacterium ABcell3]
MKNTYLITAFHLFLVILFMVVFNYQQTSDAIRYIAISNEFLALELTPEFNCNTAPGYPLFLAIIKVITGHNKYVVAIIQSIIFVFSTLYFINSVKNKYNLSDNAAFFLLAFFMVFPEFIHANGSTFTESICASLLLLIGGAIVNFKKKTDHLILIIAPISLALVKFEYLYVVIILLCIFLYEKKFKTLSLSVILLGICLTMNGLKNKHVFGVFQPTSFGSGTVIYGGNNTNLDGSWHIYGITKNYIPKKHEASMDSIIQLSAQHSCIEKDKFYKKMALDAWKNSYIDQIKTIPLKAGKLWLLPGSMDFYTGQVEIKTGLQIKSLFSDELWPWYGKYKHGIYLIIYWVYLAISLTGVIIKLRTIGLDKIDVFFLSILIINTAIYSIPFYGLGRFHLPVLPLLVYYSVFVYSKLFSSQRQL